MPQPAPLLPLRAAEQERPADPVPVPTTGVRLVFAAGPAVALDPADPRTKTFLMVAGELLRAAPEARGHGQL